MSQYALARRRPLRDTIADGIVSFSKPVYFLLRKRREPWDMTMQDLQRMPQGTLGNDLYHFLSDNGLKIMPRGEFHDIHHVLFEYGTDMKHETMLQFIPLGNGKHTLPYLLSTAVSVLFYPEHWGEYYRAYQRGRRANRFYHWDLRSMLGESTRELRYRIFGDERGKWKG